ncbi:MAG: hypothetical protein K9H61_07410 [Bacteroidia bacterium]|nr:hypothetical protein [Bacteroidia bacterium]MCF8446808.1 hypothetical protein [Bacteroidia bacterium]
MRTKIILGLIVGFAAIFSSCKSDDPPKKEEPTVNPYDTLTQFTGFVLPETGSITFSMDYNFDGAPIVLNTQSYVTAGGDTFSIKDLKHYLTNITLKRADGSDVKLGNYNLLDYAVESSKTFTLSNVPAGNYVGLTLLIGVDPLRNHEGLQEGALDPAYGMFWTWSTGYIFFRINGPTSKGTNYSFDLGGDSNLPTTILDLKEYKLKSKSPKINLVMDVNEMFQNPETYSFETDGYVLHSETEPNAPKLSGNMDDMVSVHSIE